MSKKHELKKPDRLLDVIAAAISWRRTRATAMARSQAESTRTTAVEENRRPDLIDALEDSAAVTPATAHSSNRTG